MHSTETHDVATCSYNFSAGFGGVRAALATEAVLLKRVPEARARSLALTPRDFFENERREGQTIEIY